MVENKSDVIDLKCGESFMVRYLAIGNNTASAEKLPVGISVASIATLAIY